MTRLDHTSVMNKEEFPLRYWYDVEDIDITDPTTPLFLYICGEYECRPPEGFGRDFPHVLAKEHDAMMLVLEHRYYGDS